MAVRNFYISGDVDGRRTDIGAGPQRKDGGMFLKLTQRENGEIVEAAKISCYVNDRGQLVTSISARGHETIEVITER